MINPVILGAVVLQSVVSNAVSRTAGAVLGFVITGGILAWGLAAYDTGGGIALFGIPLPKGTFVALCLAWFAYDIAQYRKAKEIDQAPAGDAADAEPAAQADNAPAPFTLPTGEGSEPRQA